MGTLFAPPPPSPPPFLASFILLFNNKGAMSLEATRRVFTSEMGKSPSEYFSYFCSTPIASASLGQVHEATTKDGKRVAVKIQREGLHSMVNTGLSFPALSDSSFFYLLLFCLFSKYRLTNL